MPAIMTHDFFGQDAYELLDGALGEGIEEKYAFLLGNQGPDPLFYAAVNPLISKHAKLGSIMHAIKTNELLATFRKSLYTLPEDEISIGRAYLCGFLCHYLLDSTMHPLVYSNQYALCDAGVEGLTRADGNEVHAVIESEFDEVMLFTRTGQTVATFAPEREILRASNRTLDIIGKLYSYMASLVYEREVPVNVFRLTTKSFRFTQSVFHSASGTKRSAIARMEELVRTYSFYRAMAHRAIEATECTFDNHQHDTWVNPFTQATSTASFNDLYEAALDRVVETINLFDAEGFNEETAQLITHGLNFSGNPGGGEE